VRRSVLNDGLLGSIVVGIEVDLQVPTDVEVSEFERMKDRGRTNLVNSGLDTSSFYHFLKLFDIEIRNANAPEFTINIDSTFLIPEVGILGERKNWKNVLSESVLFNLLELLPQSFHVLLDQFWAMDEVQVH